MPGESGTIIKPFKGWRIVRAWNTSDENRQLVVVLMGVAPDLLDRVLANPLYARIAELLFVANPDWDAFGIDRAREEDLTRALVTALDDVARRASLIIEAEYDSEDAYTYRFIEPCGAARSGGAGRFDV